jgi:hypothetical protein
MYGKELDLLREAEKLETKANIQSRVHPLPLLSSPGHQEQYTKKLSSSDMSSRMEPTPSQERH